MDVYEGRYRVLKALIQEGGPCTSEEVENMVSLYGGPVIDAAAVLRDMNGFLVEQSSTDYKWFIPGYRQGDLGGQS